MFGNYSKNLLKIPQPILTASMLKKWKPILLCFLFTACFHFQPYLLAQEIVISNQLPSSSITTWVEEIVDVDKVSSVQEIISSTKFIKRNTNIPLYNNEVKSVWLKFIVVNNSTSPTLFLNIGYPNLSEVSIYKITDQKGELLSKDGNNIISVSEIEGSPNILFNLDLKPKEQQQYLLHVNSNHPIIIPAEVCTYDAINQSITIQTIITGLYLGVLAVMFFYNFFLFLVTRDVNYILYVIYILFLAIAQITIAGYGHRFLWPNTPSLNNYSVVITSSLSALSGLLFSMFFLRTSYYLPKFHKWLQLLVGIYVFGLILAVSNKLSISYNILNYNGLVSVLSVLIASFYIIKKGFRPAYFYLVAWLLLLIAFVILILRNLAVLPYNNFTTYIIYIGSAFEVALLSIALADKINILRKEKELSTAAALASSLENERLVREQNIMLEQKVTERTSELQTAITNLQDAQVQLVEAEKMASLGQLTAGIAHEINNPINFVKSNIKPLQLDIKDLLEVITQYDKLHQLEVENIPAQLTNINKFKKQIDIDYVKTEIENLMDGIREGAERTAEIVQGLRTFSRLDESEIKVVNIHEGIDSTLLLLKNSLPNSISIDKNFAANGTIECFPGKLNQVFMNILSNGIQSIKSKLPVGDEHITITTKDVGNTIEISIKDTGIGMTEQVKQKIFDPFFTTKDVGEGTGLGLSIVFKIIEKHGGKIEVNTEFGKGAEFLLTLFHTLPETVTD